MRKIFEAPEDAYTRALLACRPPLARRARRLPVIEDFLGGPPPQRPERPARLDAATRRSSSKCGGLAKSFYFREGLFGRKEFKAVKDASFRLARGKTLGVVGESGSGKTTLALTLMRLHPASGGEVLFNGRGSAVDAAAGGDAVQAQDADRLPESLRFAQSALYRRPDPDRADADPRHRSGTRRSAARSRASCWRRWACRSPRSSSILTNFPEGSGRASRSPAA